MKTQVQVTYRHMAPSEPLTALINEQVSRLEEFDEHMIGCHVVVEEPNQNHHRGKHFRVEIVVSVKGAELVAGRDPSEPYGEDAYQVVRDSFHAIRRQLQEHAQRARHEVKHHTKAIGDGLPPGD